MKENYLLIPVDFCAHALSTHKETTHHLYLLLKSHLPGYGYLANTDISALSGYLNKHKRTTRRHLDTLIRWNYVGYNSETGLYFIRSWSRIRRIIDFRFVTGVEWKVIKIEDPQAFFAGVFIGRIAKVKERKTIRAGEEPAQFQSDIRAFPGSNSSPFFPIADRALASILDISKTKARDLKQKAYRRGFISLKHNYKPFIQNGQQVKIKYSQKPALHESFPEIAERLRIDRQGRVSLLCADLVKPNLLYKKGRNFT